MNIKQRSGHGDDLASLNYCPNSGDFAIGESDYYVGVCVV